LNPALHIFRGDLHILLDRHGLLAAELNQQ
jgi:hypothetical protein